MKQKKTRIIVLLTSVLVFLLSCALQIQDKVNKDSHNIVFVESKYLETNINNDTVQNGESLENRTVQMIALFSKQKDTLTIFSLDSENYREVDQKNTYTSIKINEKSRVFLISKYKDSLKVEFNKNNQIKVENDIYTVNNSYYNYLKQKILQEGSIIDFIDLIDDGYGDYCYYLHPLIDYKWTNEKPSGDFKIINVLVNTQSTSSDMIYSWNVSYNNGVNGFGDYFKKTLVDENKKFKVFDVYHTNQRISDSKIIYTNKETLLDSISGTWEAYSKSMAKYYIEYTQYQSKLEIVETEKPPKDIESMLKLFNNQDDNSNH